jgi:hypothetical protein
MCSIFRTLRLSYNAFFLEVFNFYSLHSKAVIDFEELLATSIFRTAEGASRLLTNGNHLWNFIISKNHKLTNYIFSEISEISTCLYYCVGHFPTFEIFFAYLVFWKSAVIPILADDLSLYSKMFLVLKILPMAAIERVIYEHERWRVSLRIWAATHKRMQSSFVLVAITVIKKFWKKHSICKHKNSHNVSVFLNYLQLYQGFRCSLITAKFNFYMRKKTKIEHL